MIAFVYVRCSVSVGCDFQELEPPAEHAVRRDSVAVDVPADGSAIQLLPEVVQCELQHGMQPRGQRAVGADGAVHERRRLCLDAGTQLAVELERRSVLRWLDGRVMSDRSTEPRDVRYHCAR